MTDLEKKENIELVYIRAPSEIRWRLRHDVYLLGLFLRSCQVQVNARLRFDEGCRRSPRLRLWFERRGV